MTHTLFTMPLTDDADVVRARLAARRAVELLGMDRNNQTRVATAVSEIARNAVAHGRGGQMSFGVDRPVGPSLLEVAISDHGPGIAQLDDVLQGRKVFEAGFGKGLLSAKRLVHEFDIQSAAGAGTQVRLTQRIPRELGSRMTRQHLEAIKRVVPAHGVDPMVELREQDMAIAESLDGLREREDEAERLNRELDETNRGVVALYSELDHKAEQLRQVSDLKSRFLSHMSHEFRTPLSSILALSRLLSDHVDGDLNSEQEKQVEYIRKSAQGLLEMVNDLLDLAKVEAGKVDIKPSRFSIRELFGSLRGSLKPLQQDRNVELVFDEPDSLPDMYADEAKVSQVLRNFVSNALKFTERGRVTVSARLADDNGHVLLSVQDTGVGIAAEAQRYIFEEFSQIEGRLQHGGTGLGLSLSRRLANLMGGEVGVQSVVGEGSTFTLTLPLQWGLGNTAEKPAQPANASILVVDDEESFRYVIRHIARDGGFEVAEAEDGVAGFERIAERMPDVIVLDLHMPRMNGFDMLDKLSDDPRLQSIPVIVCTSQALSLEQKLSLAKAHAIVLKHDLSRDGLTALINAAMPSREVDHA
jgi:signal transduction histidine kinase/CheY-like chemotaxis protein